MQNFVCTRINSNYILSKLIQNNENFGSENFVLQAFKVRIWPTFFKSSQIQFFKCFSRQIQIDITSNIFYFHFIRKNGSEFHLLHLKLFFLS